MKSKMTLLAAVAAIGVTCNVLAADAPKTAEPVTVSGTVNIVRDLSGAIVGIQLITSDGQSYDVAMNDEGQLLKRERGRKIEAKGTVSEKDGKKQLDIQSFKAEEPAPLALPGK